MLGVGAGLPCGLELSGDRSSGRVEATLLSTSFRETAESSIFVNTFILVEYVVSGPRIPHPCAH